MKKYRITFSDGREQYFINAEFTSRKKAWEFLMEYINNHNEDLDDDDNDYLTPFDFSLEEFEASEVNEIITDFETARECLGGNPNMDFIIAKKSVSRNAVRLEDVTRLVQSLNPSHIEALIALNEFSPSHKHGTRKMALCLISRIGIKTSGFLGLGTTRMLRASPLRIRMPRRRMRLRISVLGFASNRPREPNNSASNPNTYSTKYSYSTNNNL